MHLYVNANFLGGVPEELDGVENPRILDEIAYAVRQREVHFEDGVARMVGHPGGHLFPLHVLQTTLVETQAYHALRKKI